MTSASSPLRGLALGGESSDETSTNQPPFSSNCFTKSQSTPEGLGLGSELMSSPLKSPTTEISGLGLGSESGSMSPPKRPRTPESSGSGSGSIPSPKKPRTSESSGSDSESASSLKSLGTSEDSGPDSESMPSPPKSTTPSNSPASSPPLSPPQPPVSPLSHVGSTTSADTDMEATLRELALKDINGIPIAIYILSEFPKTLPVYYQCRTEYSSFFLWTAHIGNYAAVKYLIEEGVADPMEHNTHPYGADRTALHYAALHGHPAMISYLLGYLHEDGVEVDYVQDRNGFTALHLACIKPAIEPIRLLLAHPCGINPNILSNDLSTALHIAAKSADEDTIELIVEYGADPNMVNWAGYTPLMIAAEHGNGKAIVKLAESDELDLNHQSLYGGDTALHLAVRGGYLQEVKYLLRMGADYHVVNFFSKTVLDYTLEDMPLLEREKQSCKDIMAILKALADDASNKWALINHEDDMVARTPPASPFELLIIEQPMGWKRSHEESVEEWEVDIW